MKIGNIFDYYPLTPMQEGLYYQHIVGGEERLYSEQLTVYLEGELTEEQLDRAWESLRARHDILRTIIIGEELVRPVQVVLKEVQTGQVRLIEPHESPEHFLESFARDELERGFSLDEELIRLYGVRMGEDRFALLLTFHHIILDGWSVASLMNELITLLGSSKVDALRVPPFSRYVEWIYKKDEGGAGPFWRDYLEGYSRPTPFPATGERGKMRRAVRLDRELSEELRGLAARCRSSLSAIFQLIWGLILQRYADCDDVIFGLVQTVRPGELPQAAELAGLCINTVPFRLQGMGGMTVAEGLAELFIRNLRAYNYNHLPLKKILAGTELGEELFRTLLTVHNFKGFDSTGSHRVLGYELLEQTQYDMVISIDPAEEIGIGAAFDLSRISTRLMEQILGHFELLSRRMTADPGQRIDSLSLVGEGHRVPELKGALGKGLNIYERFKECAHRYGESKAVSYEEHSLSYRELLREVDHFAAALSHRGVKGGDIIALMLEPGLEMVIAIYALLKLGAAYLPLDKGSPRKMVRHMLEDSGAAAVIAFAELEELIPGSLPIYDPRRLRKEPYRALSEELDVGSESIAYIIYTSGSTGTPKGVLVSHNNLAGIVLYPNYMTINPQDRLLLLSSYSFDGSCIALYGALLQGAELVISPKSVLNDVKRIGALLVEREISVLFITTALFNLLVDTSLSSLAGVGKIIFGGERASLPHVRRAFSYLGKDRLINGYGPTETTVFASTYRINSLDESHGHLPIGYPVRGRGLYVLDRKLNLQPEGAVGELYISGEGVAKGYLNRPELTKERFLDSIESSWYERERVGTLYRTGDLVRYNHTGGLEFIGRRDNQIKIRGFRVELGEIESRLGEHEAVREALVIHHRPEGGNGSILAYVTLNYMIAEAELCNYLREELPYYMIPSNIILLEEFPIHSRGKVDRSALPLPQGESGACANGVGSRTLSELEEGKSTALSEAERELIIHRFNSTASDYPAGRTIHSLFEEQVERTPESRALIFGEESLSYREFNERANSLARVLRSKGVRPDTIVAIMAERSFELVIAIYAVLKAGGAYLPIDPHYPPDRISYLLEDSGAVLLLTGVPFVSPSSWEREIIELSNQELYCDEGSNLPHLNRVNDLAYLIYTSGSTGRPKGVMVEHTALVNRLYWQQKLYPIGSEDTILQKTTFTFDVSLWELFWWGITGARLSLLEPGAEKSPALIAEAIERDGVRAIHFVPSMLTPFLRYAGSGNIAGRLSSLRHIICSGEALTAGHVESFRRVFSGNEVELHNLYGPTEAAIDVSYFECSEYESGPVPIGKPVANTALFILNSESELCPIGVAGELCIAGVQLARGYLNNESLTKEKFVETAGLGRSWTEEAVIERFYRTGDLARWRSDGNIEYLGRIDHQVKIRGFRIELGEIESRLAAHPEVEEALVTVHRPDEEIALIYVYLISRGGVGESELLELLRGELPSYMLPANIIFLKEFPLLKNGKVDRKALPLPGRGSGTDSGEEEKHSESEKVLLEIWQDIFTGASVGLDDSFHSLGGDSILALKVVHRAGKRGLSFTADQLMKLGTIRALAAMTGEGAVRDKVVSIEGALPLTPIQGYYFGQAGGVVNRFNQSVVLELHNRPAADELEEIWARLTARHPSLRLSFSGEGESWKQEIGANESNFRLFRLSSLHYEEGFYLPYQEGLDIERGHLTNLVYYQVSGEERVYLAIIIHHLAIDGVSWQILLDELSELLAEQKSAAQPEEERAAEGYREWVSLLSSLKIEREEREFWLKQSRSRPRGELFLPRPGQEREQGRGETLLTFEAEKLALLERSFLYTHGAALPDLLLTLFLRTLANYTGEDRLRIDLESHGRGRAEGRVELSAVTGWFTSLYPLNFSLNRSGSFEKSLAEVRSLLDSLPEQGSGYGLLRYRDKVEELVREPAGAEIAFNYLGSFDRALGENVPFEIAEIFTKGNLDEQFHDPHRLTLDGLISGECLRIRFSYDRAFFSKKEVEELALNFRRSFYELLAGCRREESWGTRLPLAPNRRWYFTRTMDLERWGPVLFFQLTDSRINSELLQRAVGRLYRESDSLRLRYRREGGEWHEYAAPGGWELPYSCYELGEADGDELDEGLERCFLYYQSRLKMEGPLCRFVYLDRGHEREPIFMVMLHHLLMDLYSLQLLFDRLGELVETELAGVESPSLMGGTSYSEWSGYLARFAATEEAERHSRFWEELPWQRVRPLPVDFSGAYERNTIGSTTSLRRALSREETDQLYSSPSGESGITVPDRLFYALLKGFNSWRGLECLVAEVVSHGRDLKGEGMDISSTIGWFNNFIPYLFSYRADLSEGEMLAEIAALRESYEREGRYFGLRESRTELPPFELAFNYVPPGLKVGNDRIPPFLKLQKVMELRGENREGGHLFSTDFEVIDGELTLTLSYSTALHKEESAARLAELIIEAL